MYEYSKSTYLLSIEANNKNQLQQKRPHKDKYVREQAVKINIRKGENGFCQIGFLNMFKA